MRIVCFGDSNTFGYDPRFGSGGRYPGESRWVDLLESRSGHVCLNEGMNGREIPQTPISLGAAERIFILLGTNDLLRGRSSQETARRMDVFLRGLSAEKEGILLLAPPPLKQGEWTEEGAIRFSRELGKAYRGIAEKQGIAFLDTGEWELPLCFDGVHFTEEAHRIVALKLYEYLEKEKETCLRSV